METYDMKPDAPSDYRGIFSPIKTNVPGMEVCELLPLHAKIAEMPLGVHRAEAVAAAEAAALSAPPTIELKGLLR